MRIVVGEEHGYGVVRPSGRLSARTSPHLRTALLKAAAEQPPALVCDLRECVADAAGLTVLLVVADEVGRWPTCPAVVLATDPDLRDLLGRVGVAQRMPLVSSLPEVARVLGGGPAPRSAVLRLSPDRNAPRRAREFLADKLSEAQLDDDDACGVSVVVDELVTNAVLHAGTQIDLRVSVWPDALRVAVADLSDRQATPRAAAELDENGRGLALVEGLSTRWGVLPRHPAGKVVWAVLPRV